MTPTQCICEKPYIAVGTKHCTNCGGYPTEDTPTHDPQQDNLPPFHFRCQQGKVHSIEEGCDCKQDDKQLCQRCGGAVPKRGVPINYDGPICTGLHSPVIEQDDKQLREALADLPTFRLHPVGCSATYPEGKCDCQNKTDIEALLALFQKEQIQLVSELTKTAKHYTADGLVADALDPWAVPVKELEYKKQELERGK